MTTTNEMTLFKVTAKRTARARKLQIGEIFGESQESAEAYFRKVWYEETYGEGVVVSVEPATAPEYMEASSKAEAEAIFGTSEVSCIGEGVWRKDRTL